MTYTDFETKNGMTFTGFIWKWRPQEGYLTVGGVFTHPFRLEFDEIKSAVREDGTDMMEKYHNEKDGNV